MALYRSEDYIHRVGRVGRAEALGLAISLVATVEEKVACIVCWYSSKETPESPYRTWCHLVEAHWTRPRTNPDTSALVPAQWRAGIKFHIASPLSPAAPFQAHVQAVVMHSFRLLNPRAHPPLQVWYCSVKGLQPWRQPDAKNTRTNDKGGHTIWYDEPQLLQVSNSAHRDCVLSHQGRGHLFVSTWRGALSAPFATVP